MGPVGALPYLILALLALVLTPLPLYVKRITTDADAPPAAAAALVVRG
jgi:hypothetical protein